MHNYHRYIPYILIIIATSLYIFTLDTGLRTDELMGGDLITHQYAQVQGRPSNAPGYPLYTMLGWVWFRVGRLFLSWLFNPIQILSFYSTLWGLASLWILYHLLMRPEVTNKNWGIAILLTSFYGVTYFFWYYSVTTEQYTSAIFQTLLIVWLAFEWEQNPSNKILLMMAFMCGTMLANMITTLFILPPLFYLIFSKRPRILTDIKLVMQAIIFGLFPTISYAYIYIRGLQHPEWRGEGEWTNVTEWFFQFITIQQGQDELTLGLTLENIITHEFPSIMAHELTLPVLLGGIIGLGMFGRRKAIFFYGTLFIYMAFVVAYRFGNWFQVILPMYPLIVLGFGKSITYYKHFTCDSWLMSTRQERFLKTFLVLTMKTLSLLLIMLVSYRFIISLPQANQHYLPQDTALEPGWAIITDISKAGMGNETITISPEFQEWLALQYLLEIWDVDILLELHEPNTPAEFITRQAIIAQTHQINLESIHPQAIGREVIHLKHERNIIASELAILSGNMLNFGGMIYLIDYEVYDGGELITMSWLAPNLILTDYTMSVRLWQHGQPIEAWSGLLIQDHRPVWNMYPTNYWHANEIVKDSYTFTLPPHAQPDQIQIVIYHVTEDGFENLDAHFLNIDF